MIGLKDAYGVIQFTGVDAKDFLHRLASQDFLKNQLDSVISGAFLSGTGRILALCESIATEDRVLLFFEKNRVNSIYEYFEKMHFGEDLSFEILKEIASEVRGTEEELSGLSGWRLYDWKDGQKGMILLGTTDADVEWLARDRFLSKRAENSVPTDGLDIGPQTMVLDCDFDERIDRDKGCYPGQEVVEKVYTYGRRPKKLIKLELEHKIESEGPWEIGEGGQKFGQLTSQHQLVKGRWIALGFVRREKADVGKKLEVFTDGSVAQIVD